ncbi:MAG: hypothetical protein JXB62_17760 [Pirellulales bacterium]|nr:hypothetical protein [Pirellulales bacterium]
MTNYQLAKLVLMAQGIESRKRIQKTVHLLQAAGCRFDLEFRLHYYGPYSSSLAEQLDRMTAADMLTETTQQIRVGTQYNYRLNETQQRSLEDFEKTADGQTAKRDMEDYRELLDLLRRQEARVLELASTMVAFRQAQRDWDRAAAETARFKNEPADAPPMTEARELAQNVVGCNHG